MLRRIRSCTGVQEFIHRTPVHSQKPRWFGCGARFGEEYVRMQPDSFGLISRTAAIAAGYSNTDLQRLCLRGELQRLVPGHYARRGFYDSLDARQKHRLLTVATLRANSEDAIASHISAAVVHGLDLWNTDLGRVHLTVPGGHGRTTRRLHVHTGAVPAGSVMIVDGVPVTTLARTLSDCARILDLDHAVVIGDSGLRSKKVSADQLRAAVECSARSAGVGAARRAVAAMNGLSESPGGSR